MYVDTEGVRDGALAGVAQAGHRVRSRGAARRSGSQRSCKKLLDELGLTVAVVRGEAKLKEEHQHAHSAVNGENCPHVICDMVFYETPNGGAVFSTSSIAFAGSLAHNGYDNNVSRLLENVVTRFCDPEPIPAP